MSVRPVASQTRTAAGQQSLSPITVVVLDAGGHLLAAEREDGSANRRFDIAFGKAWGALGMGFGSRTLASRAAKTPQFFTMLAAASDGRMVTNPGGVLLRNASGDIVGLFFHNYPSFTGQTRNAVFGRLAGKAAVAEN